MFSFLSGELPMFVMNTSIQEYCKLCGAIYVHIFKVYIKYIQTRKYTPAENL